MSWLDYLAQTLFAKTGTTICLVLLLGFACCGSACTRQWRTMGGVAKGVPVRFQYVDAKAHKICVVGSFNNWSTQSDCLLRSGGDSWSLVTFLPPGRYQYRFVINDEIWRPDPHAVINEQDGFGGQDSILIVE